MSSERNLVRMCVRVRVCVCVCVMILNRSYTCMI